MKLPYTIERVKDQEQFKQDYQKLLLSNAAATAFIKEIENGNLNAGFPPETVLEDELPQALLSMQRQLKKIEEEEKQRNWTTEGLASFVDLLRSDSGDLQLFYQKIISNLVKYVGANQGGLFLIDEQNSSEVKIELVSCYAYNRQKFIRKQLSPGEGLVGQCFLEKETIFLTDVPQDYVQITSGLGHARPGCIVIVPLKVGDAIHGMVELAGFEVFKPYEVEFLERLGESIASTIASVKINERTRKLLEDSQMQAEALRAQEEEMRQNMEELSATQEEMERVIREAQASESYVRLLMEASKDAIFVVDKSYAIIDFNPAFLVPYQSMNLRIEKGDSVFNILKEDEREKHRKLYDRVLYQGESFDIQEYIATVDRHYITAYSPLRNSNGEIDGVAIFGKDITEVMKAQEEVASQTKELQNVLNRFHLAAETTTEGLWDMEMPIDLELHDDTFFWWSDKFRQMLGYENEQDFPNRLDSWANLLHPDDKQATVDAFSAHLMDFSAQTPYDVENRILRKSGEYRWYRAIGNTQRDQEGKPVRVAGTLIDIQAQKDMQELLRKGEQNKAV